MQTKQEAELESSDWHLGDQNWQVKEEQLLDILWSRGLLQLYPHLFNTAWLEM